MTPLMHLLVMLSTGLTPLLVALAILVKRDSAVLHSAAAAAALPALLTSLLVPPGIAATLPWLLEGSEFGLDAVGRVFLFFSAAIWLAGGAHARASIAPAERDRFFLFFLLVMSGNLGLIVARDMLAFYLFFALMSFATYGLVVHRRTAASQWAGRVYMSLVVAGDLMLYAGLVVAALDAGGTVLLTEVQETIVDSPHAHMIVALIVAGFGVKVGLLGLHVTLPLIYGAVPTPAAAVLAGAMINAGLLGWLRFLPLGDALPGWGAALAGLGLAAAFYAVAVGVLQRRAAVVLAYSSISQMGIVTAAVGTAMLAPEDASAIVAALAVYAMHHGFAKGALFLGLGAGNAAGGAWRRAALRAGLLLPSLALAGAPLTSGMLAKEHLKETLAAAPGGEALAAVLPWTAFATTLIVARFLWLAWPRSSRAEEAVPAPAGRLPTAAWLATLLLSVIAVWLQPIDHPPGLWRAGVVWNLVWPIAAGTFVAWLVLTAAAARRLPRLPAVPPGDIVAPAGHLVRGLLALWGGVTSGPLPAAREAARTASLGVILGPLWSRTAGAAEALLGRWAVAAMLFVALIIVFAILTIA